MILMRDGRPVAVFTPGKVTPIRTDADEAEARRFVNAEQRPKVVA